MTGMEQCDHCKPDTNTSIKSFLSDTNVPPMDPRIYYLLEVVVRIALIGPISISGIVTNIINLIIFYRQGPLSDSSTVSLMALAVSDFLCCLFTFWSIICLVLLRFVDTEEYRWNVFTFYLFTSLRPKTILTQITCWITAYIAFERVFSVVFPFLVKAIFTPKRTLALVSSIFVLTVIMYYPQYIADKPVWSQVPGRNFSKLSYIRTDLVDRYQMKIFIYTNPIGLRIVGVSIVLVCNVVIFWKVKLSHRFRKSSAASKTQNTSAQNKGKAVPTVDEKTRNATANNVDATSTSKPQKELRLLRMITIICIVFLVCFIPDVVIVVLFYTGLTNFHLFIRETVHAVSMLLETVNSSCNIFIYYRMSTRYRQELNACWCSKTNES